MTLQKKKKSRGYVVTWDSDGSLDSETVVIMTRNHSRKH